MPQENFRDIQEKGKRLEALINLSNNIKYRERRLSINYNDFLYMASINPLIVFRDIFQLFDDMTSYYIPEADSDVSNKKIGFLDYDCSNLFVTSCDNPFFADRLFANRFMNLVKALRKGTQDNRIYLFEGPPGSGKSTFLNNLLLKLEEYTRTPEGRMYKTYWRLDAEVLGGLNLLQRQVQEIVDKAGKETLINQMYNKKFQKTLDFSCPNNDHPILQIPVSYRREFLDELISDEGFKDKLFNSNEYRWVLKDIPCHICNSLSTLLMDSFGDPMEVFKMIHARSTTFNRQFGKGVSIFNPGDPLIKNPISNNKLQNAINDIFNSDDVYFVNSFLARTNNGVLALMDIKENNIQRLMSLHGIISDGVHKIDLIEERIKSLFVGLVNPEDKKHFSNVKSFQDRIITVHIPYVLDYSTEVSIYKNKFGDKICDNFLPRVLENFTKIIIATRLQKTSPVLTSWLKSPESYRKYIDKDLFLLKMDIYSGRTPSYLEEEDLNSYDIETKKKIIAASEQEGKSGFSGRRSLNLFNNFYSKYSKSIKLINMEMIVDYFKSLDQTIGRQIPVEFIGSLNQLYDFNILQEVNEAIYYFNKKQISRDIKNYMFAINFDLDETVKCTYTGDKIKLTKDYFKNFEAIFTGTTSTIKERDRFRHDNHNEYITKTLAQEIRVEGRKITETSQFKSLFDKYTKILKENALAPYAENTAFKRAILSYGTKKYKKANARIRRDAELLINNLQKKFNYSEKGALQIALYVLDKKLIKKLK